MARLSQATADHDMAARVQIGELEAEKILPIGESETTIEKNTTELIEKSSEEEANR